MVGYQPAADDTLTAEPVSGKAFFLEYSHMALNDANWVDHIPSMTVDQVLEKLIEETPTESMTLNVKSVPVLCNLTFDQALDAASVLLKSLPKFPITNQFDEFKAKNQIAKNTLRGGGNARIDDVLVYRGTQDLDCGITIVKVGGRYGVAKHPSFYRYGFVLNDGTKI